MKKIIAVSGGFDPIHIGHVRMIREARALGTSLASDVPWDVELVVILNNDKWLMRKKGFVFMPEAERQEIIEALEGVSRVVLTKHVENDPDTSVCGALREIQPNVFANGGDRFADNIPEAILAKELGIECVFGVGRGGKVQSSSWLTSKIKTSSV